MRPCAADGATPARWIAPAIIGDAARNANGTTIATATIRAAAARETTTSGDDSSTTGSSVQADMVQSELISMPNSGASTAGINSGAQNVAAASRRSGVVGLSASVSAARFGRMTARASNTGNAT